MPQIQRIFVYGTLRPGQSAYSLIAKSVASHIPATTLGQLVALPAGYPGLLSRGNGRVVGDLLTLARDMSPGSVEESLRALDRYEGDEYDRELREVSLGDGTNARAWCYVLREAALTEGWRVVESGDWLRYSSQQR